MGKVQLEREIGRVWESEGLKNRSKAIWRGAVDASGRFEAINSRGDARLRVRRGFVVRRPIGRCALAARSCISTLANHSFRLIVGKSAALRARCHAAQNAYSLSPPRHGIPRNRIRRERAMPLNIYRSRGIKFCASERAISQRAARNRRKRGHYGATKLRIGKTEIVIKSSSEKIMHREKASEREKDRREKSFTEVKSGVTSIFTRLLFNYLAHINTNRRFDEHRFSC